MSLKSLVDVDDDDDGRRRRRPDDNDNGAMDLSLMINI